MLRSLMNAIVILVAAATGSAGVMVSAFYIAPSSGRAMETGTVRPLLSAGLVRTAATAASTDAKARERVQASGGETGTPAPNVAVEWAVSAPLPSEPMAFR